MAAISITDLTTGDVSGTGVFDELMKATKAHIHEEYAKSRIKGPEYATVYLGALQATMDRALQFLLNKQRTDLEAQLLQEQIESEGLNQALITQQTANLAAEALNIPKQGILLDKQALHTESQTALVNQQQVNAITENDVLVAQACKLRAEFDLLSEQKLKSVAETALLNQKKLTEQAQVNAAGVDPDSVIGKQKALHQAQADGFKRDAEQKAAKLMVDTWNVRQTTDGGQTVDGNGLNDANILSAINKLLVGINAV